MTVVVATRVFGSEHLVALIRHYGEHPGLQKDAVAALGPRARFVTGDVTAEDTAREAVAAALEAGPLRVLVNCAGVATPGKLVGRDGPLSAEVLSRVLAINTVGTVSMMAQAAAIRDLLFPAGSTQALVRFDLTPGPLDPGATAATLDLGATAVSATPDAPARPSASVWPGRPRATSARLTIEGSPRFQVETQGTWAAFRLLATAKPVQAGGRTTLVFAGNDRTARFDLRATPNPFTSPLLGEFRCPAVQ